MNMDNNMKWEAVEELSNEDDVDTEELAKFWDGSTAIILCHKRQWVLLSLLFLFSLFGYRTF